MKTKLVIAAVIALVLGFVGGGIYYAANSGVRGMVNEAVARVGTSIPTIDPFMYYGGGTANIRLVSGLTKVLIGPAPTTTNSYLETPSISITGQKNKPCIGTDSLGNVIPGTCGTTVADPFPGNATTSILTFTNGLNIGTLSGALYAVSGSVNAKATSTQSYSAEFSNTGTPGDEIGGTSGTLSLATNGVALTKIAQIGANTILGNQTGATGNVTALATSSLNIGGTAANVTGTVTVAHGGTNATSFTGNRVLYTNSAGNTVSTVGSGTTTASCAGTASCSSFTIFGSSPVTITGSGISSAITALGPTGQTQTGPTVTIASSTGSFNGLTLGVTAVGNTNTITFTPGITGTLGNAGLTNSTISGIALGGTLNAHTHDATLTGTSYNGSAAVSNWGIDLTHANSWTGLQTFANATSTLLSSTYASSTSAFFGMLNLPGISGTQCLHVIGGVVSGTGADCGTGSGGITSIGPTGQTQTGPAVTFSTTTTAFNGLTSNLTVTGATNNMQFAPTLSGTLGVGGGGTGQTTFTAGNLVYGAGSGALQNVATTTFTPSGEFTVGGTIGALVGGANSTLALATGGVGLTKLAVQAANTVLVNGTGGSASPTAQATSTFGTNLFGIGTNGKVLAEVLGVPTWTSTTTDTCSTGITCAFTAGNNAFSIANGAVTDAMLASTFVKTLTVATANGFAGSFTAGATPALTISTTVTGLLKGNGTAISAATAGTDYIAGGAGAATTTVSCAGTASCTGFVVFGASPITITDSGTTFGKTFEIDAAQWLSPTTTATFGINTNTQGTTYGYGIGDALLGYASSTNHATIWGLQAGGQNATTSATIGDTTVVGYQAGKGLLTALQSTAIGSQALTIATTSPGNTAIGYQALAGLRGGATVPGIFSATGLNTAVGALSLASTTSGNSNTALGYRAGGRITTGTQNVAIGDFALAGDTVFAGDFIGSANIAIGVGALQAAGSTGGAATRNVYIGTNAGVNTGGSSADNVVIGDSAGSGSGLGSLRSQNTIIGSGAGPNITTAFNNVLLGYKAGNFVTSGFDNIILGPTINSGGDAPTTGGGNILFGYNPVARNSADTRFLNIGNTIFGQLPATTSATSIPTNFAGRIGIGTTTPAYMLTLSSSTASQITLTDGSVVNAPFNMRANGRYFTIGTSSPLTFATTTLSILQLDSVTGSTTVQHIDTTSNATNTFSGGINLTAGCFSIGGVCIGTTQTDDYQAFTSSGTWTKPAGLTGNEMVVINAWGGGGAGGSTGAGSGAIATGGGGGGACITMTRLASAMGATETVTVGAGGTPGAGTPGGNTTVGTFLTAYGGGNGTDDASITTVGGAGGGAGLLSAGENFPGTASTRAGGAGGSPLGGPGGTTAAGTDNSGFGGAGGGFSGTTGGAGGTAAYGGAGGGGASRSGAGLAGGSAVCGGAGGGGGGSTAGGSGGTSIQGGAGGAGATGATGGGSGTAPGGAGGGTGKASGTGTATGGSGARGEVRIWVIKS